MPFGLYYLYMNTKDNVKNSSAKTIILTSLLNFLKGILVGGAVIVPGFSSGTVMILCGIYEPLLDNVSGLAKGKFLKGFLFLLPIALGAIVGVAIVAFALTRLLQMFALPIFALFAGLIAGGIPTIVSIIYEPRKKRAKLITNYELITPVAESEFKINSDGNNIEHNQHFSTKEQAPDIKNGSKKITEPKYKNFEYAHLEPMLIAFIVVIGLAVVQRFVYVPAFGSGGIIGLFMVFVGGVLGGMALLIPGLSGALMLILLGQYDTVLNAISISGFSFSIVGVFIIGTLIGLILAVILVRFLLRRYRNISHLAILGFLAGSVVSIFILPNTYYSATNTLGIVLAVVFFAVGAIGAYFLSKLPSFILSRKNKRL